MSLYLSLAGVFLEGRDLIAHVSGSLRRGMGHPARSCDFIKNSSGFFLACYVMTQVKRGPSV